MAFSPVGAYNVGSIELAFEPELKTNLPSQTAESPASVKKYDTPVQLKAGDNIGFFNLGSSIVMIFEAPNLIFKVRMPFFRLPETISEQLIQVARGEKVKLGQAMTQELTPELAREHLKRLEERREVAEAQVIH